MKLAAILKKSLALVLVLCICMSFMNLSVYAGIANEANSPADTNEGSTPGSTDSVYDNSPDTSIIGVCICTTKCAEGSVNEECPVCGAEGADLANCVGTEPNQAGYDPSHVSDNGMDGPDVIDLPAETSEVCNCISKCTEGSVKEDCPICGVEGADFAQCVGIEQPSIEKSNAKQLGNYGVFDNGTPIFLDVNWLNQKLREAYSDDQIDVSKPGWHIIEGGNNYYDVELVQGEDGTFLGIRITGKKYTSTSWPVYYNYLPRTEEGWGDRYVVSFGMTTVGYGSGNGSIYGSNEIPADVEGADAYWYGTAYAGYERVFVPRTLGGYTPIVLSVLVNVEDYRGKTWAPAKNGSTDELLHVSDWTASSNYNFDVVYCADANVTVSDGTAKYRIAHVKGLDDHFGPEAQEKLQAIIEHAYPFISEEQMLKELNAAGVNLDVYSDYASELMLVATQLAIWNITNPDCDDLKYNMTAIRTTGYGVEVLNKDLSVEIHKFSAEDCLNNTTQNLNSPGKVSNDAGLGSGMAEFWAELKGIVNYLLNDCRSSIRDPQLDVVWSYKDGAVTVTGVANGVKSGDMITVTIDGNPVPVKEIPVFYDGFCPISIDNIKVGPNETVTLTVGSTRYVTEAMFYESEEYQNFIGGHFNPVAVSDSASFTTPETVDIDVTKVWMRNGKPIDAPEGASIGVILLKNGAPEGDPLILDATNGWTGSFKGLPKYDESDSIISYTVQEVSYRGFTSTISEPEEVDGKLTFTVTNEQQLGKLTISKALADGAPEEAKSKTYTFNVEGPEGYHETVTLTAGERKTLENLVPGQYTVTEDRTGTAIEGWTLEVSGETGEVGVEVKGEKPIKEGEVPEVYVPATVTITNKYTQELGSLTITKAITPGAPAEAYTKTYTFTVTGPGSDGESQTVTVTGASSTTLNNLVPGEYTVTEVRDGTAIENWTLRVSGEGTVTVEAEKDASVTITNTYTHNTVSASVEKVWRDENGNTLNMRTGSITVTLYDQNTSNGFTPRSVTLSASNDWFHEWTDLPAEGDYDVVESSVNGWESTVSSRRVGDNFEFTVTNWLTPDETPEPTESPEPTPTPTTTPQPTPEPTVPPTPTPSTPPTPTPSAPQEQTQPPEENDNPNEPQNPNEPTPVEDNPNQDIPNRDVPQGDRPDIPEDHPNNPNVPNVPEDEPGTDLPDVDVPTSDFPPETGETIMTIIWMGLLVVSGAGILITARTKKRE